jgi:nucleotide-binding universal stress UspA family protein
MKTILVPVDGSDHATKAAEFAGDIASKYDADVILLHVVQPDLPDDEERRFAEIEHVASSGDEPLPWTANVPAGLTAVLHRVQESATDQRILEFVGEQVIKAATQALEKHGREPARILIKDGSPAREILDAIEETGADLVVMGSRGLGALGAMALGSISQKVASHATCNVVTVR